MARHYNHHHHHYHNRNFNHHYNHYIQPRASIWSALGVVFVGLIVAVIGYIAYLRYAGLV